MSLPLCKCSLVIQGKWRIKAMNVSARHQTENKKWSVFPLLILTSRISPRALEYPRGEYPIRHRQLRVVALNRSCARVVAFCPFDPLMCVNCLISTFHGMFWTSTVNVNNGSLLAMPDIFDGGKTAIHWLEPVTREPVTCLQEACDVMQFVHTAWWPPCDWLVNGWLIN